MDFAEFASSLKTTDLRAKSRSATIRKLAQATKLVDDGISLEELIGAIEEREATAQTVVAPGFAVPHAFADWKGDFRAVLGWSREGVDYGTPDSGLVHLAILLVIGSEGKARHLEYLATLAEFFADDEFRQKLISAADSQTVRRLIREKAGLRDQPKKTHKLPRINKIMVRQALEIVPKVKAHALLIATNSTSNIPWSILRDWEGRLLVVSPDTIESLPKDRADTHLIDVPRVTLSRTDQANLGLLLSGAKGLLAHNTNVVCVTGAGERQLDSVTVIRPEPQFETMFAVNGRGRKKVLPSVILRAVALALELAEEGREGKAIGTMFVIGDTRQVQRHTQQLVLNPFHGYAKSLRSILDPSLNETIKEFAVLDGAFVVQGDGMVLSAGTYIIPKATQTKLPQGLGTRHQAAAAITAHTEAMAIVVSQSTGTVLAFRHGKVVLKLERSGTTKR